MNLFLNKFTLIVFMMQVVFVFSQQVQSEEYKGQIKGSNGDDYPDVIFELALEE